MEHRLNILDTYQMFIPLANNLYCKVGIFPYGFSQAERQVGFVADACTIEFVLILIELEENRS